MWPWIIAGVLTGATAGGFLGFMVYLAVAATLRW